MSKEKYLLFFDIDGTLAWPGHPVTERTREALKKAQANGQKIFLCTGRGERGIPQDIREIGFDGGVYHAGALAVVDGKRVVDLTIPENIWRKAAEDLDDVVMSYTIDCNVMSYKNKKYSMDYLTETFGLPESVLKVITGANNKMMDEYQGESVYKMICLCENLEKLAELKKRMNGIATLTSYENFTGDASIVHCDVCFTRVSKADGMQKIANELQTDLAHCVMFGDGENDLEALEAAGIGIAMGNAEPAALQAADRITESCLEDGIARELERMGLV